jgi:hypothetical protein
VAEAAESIRQAPRAAAHYYYAAGPEGLALGLECSAERSAGFEITTGTFVHCNHALHRPIAELEVGPPAPSTSHRQARLDGLLRSHRGGVGVEDLKRYLSDHEGGPDRCVCRHDHDSVSTNAAVIMSPATRQIHACRAQPHVGEWTVRQVGG